MLSTTTQSDQLELPDWLSSPTLSSDTTSSSPSPSKPTRTKTAKLSPSRIRMELIEKQFEIYFDTFIDKVCEGTSPTAILKESHLEGSPGQFMRWISKDSQREELYYEAQRVASKLIEGQLMEIADAADTLEDVQRSSLKIKVRENILKSWDRKRHGDIKTINLAQTISITNALSTANNRLVEYSNVIDVTPSSSSLIEDQD